MGIVAPNANGLKNYEAALREGKSGIRFIQKLSDNKFRCQETYKHNHNNR